MVKLSPQQLAVAISCLGIGLHLALPQQLTAAQCKNCVGPAAVNGVCEPDPTGYPICQGFGPGGGCYLHGSIHECN
jgi:hypothetical protein